MTHMSAADGFRKISTFLYINLNIDSLEIYLTNMYVSLKISMGVLVIRVDFFTDKSR